VEQSSWRPADFRAGLPGGGRARRRRIVRPEDKKAFRNADAAAAKKARACISIPDAATPEDSENVAVAQAQRDPERFSVGHGRDKSCGLGNAGTDSFALGNSLRDAACTHSWGGRSAHFARPKRDAYEDAAGRSFDP
jgi:hypothetical protein